MTTAGRVLVLGGQRSGKSRYAEELVLASGRVPVYVATAAAGDAEMAERIGQHRIRRGAQWRTVEEPLDLADTLKREAGEGYHVLVDCLTLWVTNLMMAERDIEKETALLLDALAEVAGPTVMVSGEVGLGVIPADRLSRRFADALGRVNQRVAAVADRVVLVAAGLPLVLKAEQTNIEAAEI
jgi:adenosylcobinamide kinase/adenosylcobinamide-phosphate guanylyltransferase